MLKSNGLHRPENLPVKFGFSTKSTSTNIAKKLPLQRCFKPLLNSSHKRPTFAFTSESGHTLGSRRKIAHSGLHGETGAVSDGGGITTLGLFHTFRKLCVARGQNGVLCRFWVLVGDAPEERREPSGQRCAYACRCPEASQPRWAALPAASMHSACFSGMERLDQAFWQSYYHTQLTERAAVWRLCGSRIGR